MTDNVTLDRVDFEKLMQQAKLARAECMRRYAAAIYASSRHIVSHRMGALMHTHYVVAVVAGLFISFGVRIFFRSE